MTLFKVDILIGGSRKEVTALNMQRYGFTNKEDAEPISRNECNTINSGQNCPLKGEIRFYLAFERHPRLIPSIFTHELWHLMWHIQAQISDFKLEYSTHSWAACMIEDISRQVLDAKYEKIYPLKTSVAIPESTSPNLL